MNTYKKPEIRELTAEELELIGGGTLERDINYVAWWAKVACDFYFNRYGGRVYHASLGTEEEFLGL